MLDLPRYLLGVAELALLAGFATLGASSLRARLLPSFSGAPAHLATAVLALALLIWTAEILGSFGLFEVVPYLVVVVLVGSGLWLVVRGGWEGPPRRPPSQAAAEPTPKGTRLMTGIALAIAAIAVVKFAADVRVKLGTGMTGFDSTWYHGPFAAGFFQSGDTWSLHFIAPQFLAWFYPANAEIFHAAGMLAFGRDLLSPLLNLGWFMGCLLACWCIGRPYRVAPWSLALGAVALSLPLLSDQAGEARNDIVGIFFLLAAVAIALNAWEGRLGGLGRGESPEPRGERSSAELGAALVAGLAAGLAAGTKLNFLPPAVVLVLGVTFLVPTARRWRVFVVAGLAALAGGGYWYLRNLVHTGNPLPWFDRLGPISLPAPGQALGGREGHSVLGYLSDGVVWSDWFLPGLHGGLTVLWPLLAAAALAGLLLCLGPRSSAALRLAGLVGLAAAFAWLVAPTSASGPDGMPRGFESGLRYLAPTVVLGLTLLAERLRSLTSSSLHFSAHSAGKRKLVVRSTGAWPALAILVVLAIAVGYPIQRHYLENRYASPTFAAPGLNATFAWADDISGARIATTSTRQYPLYGTDLSNRVRYVGEEQPHGGFTVPDSCWRWRRLLNEGDYDYVVASRDRIEPGKPPYPESARWTEGAGAEEILRKPPTVVFKLEGSLDPSACRE
jgi:hypothetical protein